MMFLWSYLQNKCSLGPACSYFGDSEQMFIASGIFMDEMQSYGYRVDALFGKVGFYLVCVLRKIRK